MDFIGYLDLGYEWFSKGLELIRGIILKASSILPLEPRLSLAIITLIVSFLISYKVVGKLVMKPLDTKYLIYLLIITWLLFTTLFYFKI